jgi:hypothetical protein
MPAQIRRDRFPPKPMTPEAALARLRRREKKILYDQIRERRRNNIGTQVTDIPAKKKRKTTYEADRFPMTIQVRDKWQEVPVYDEVAYSWLRRYLKRKFRLKRWRWDLQVKENEREGWVKVFQNPFQILKEARYRIVLTELLRKPRPGKQAPKLTKEQRRRPNSKANRGKDPLKWTAPAPEPAPTPPPVQSSVVKPAVQTPIVTAQPKANASVQKSTLAPPPTAPRRTEKQSFTWSPTPDPTPPPSPPPKPTPPSKPVTYTAPRITGPAHTRITATFWVEPGASWSEKLWSNIEDREVEEIAARHVGCQVYLKERKERPQIRDTVFYCYKGSKSPPKPSAPPKSTILDQIPLEERKNLYISAPDTPGFLCRKIADDARGCKSDQELEDLARRHLNKYSDETIISVKITGLKEKTKFGWTLMGQLTLE